MRNTYKFTVLLFIIFIIISSCGKEGLQGPDGPAGAAGPPGATGAPGAVGPAGQDGSIIYSGTGTPSATLGKAGDYYLNSGSSDLYGPKTANGWGSAISLKGTTGATGAAGSNGTNGTAGSQVYSGSGAPSPTQGINGDYYLDKINLLLYGPKTAVAGWGTPVLLSGAQGAQGPDGPAGADGSIIYSGTGAPAAALGKNGDYYFNKTTNGLYGPKTANGWGSPTLLMGASGTNGTNGTNGANGATILSGVGAPSLTQGAVGDFYLDKTSYNFYGPKSIDGWGIPVLLRGAQGAQGPVGPAGANGSIIYSGNGAPAPTIGANGDYYFDKTSRGLYGPKTGSGWGLPISLAGPQGAGGTNGTNGANGTNGNTILSGTGAPASTLGNNGDFYLDKTTYLLYGPKTAVAGWGAGTSLKAASGAGTSVTAFETANDTNLIWAVAGIVTGTTGPPTSFVLKQLKTGGDTSTQFKLPDSLANVVNNGVILVYLHLTPADGTVSQWVQLSYTNVTAPSNEQVYTYHAIINSSGVFIRINCDVSNTTATHTSPFQVDKVRVVAVPHNVAGVLTTKNKPIVQTLHQLKLNDNSFKTIR